MISIQNKTEQSGYSYLFVAFFILSLFFLFIDEGNYSFSELRHPYTWLFLLGMTTVFFMIGSSLYWLTNKMTSLSLISKTVLAFIFTIPTIFLLYGLCILIWRLFG